MTTTAGRVPDDELSDFIEEATKLGFDMGKFVLSTEETTPSNPGPITRKVTITRSSGPTSVAHVFDGSHGKDWIEPALDALKAGEFGKP